MKQFIPYIVVIIATLLVVWISKPFDSGVDVKKYEDIIIALELEINILKDRNEDLAIEADSLVTKLSEYDKVIKSLNNDIKVIRYETKQKLDAVDLLHDYELESFFTDRYRQHNDSIN